MNNDLLSLLICGLLQILPDQLGHKRVDSAVDFLLRKSGRIFHVVKQRLALFHQFALHAREELERLDRDSDIVFSFTGLDGFSYRIFALGKRLNEDILKLCRDIIGEPRVAGDGLEGVIDHGIARLELLALFYISDLYIVVIVACAHQIHHSLRIVLCVLCCRKFGSAAGEHGDCKHHDYHKKRS